MAALETEEYMAAIALMPRGQSDSFGRVHGTLRGIKPGFLKKPRYVADSNRFD
jgi:hypothetical protein